MLRNSSHEDSFASNLSSSKNFQGKEEGSTKAMLITSNYPEEESTAFCDVLLMR